MVIKALCQSLKLESPPVTALECRVEVYSVVALYKSDGTHYSLVSCVKAGTEQVTSDPYPSMRGGDPPPPLMMVPMNFLQNLDLF